LVDYDSSNLSDVLNEIDFHNHSKFLDNLHFVDYDCVIVYNDGFPSAPLDISVSQDNFISKDLDFESNSVKEDVFFFNNSLFTSLSFVFHLL